MRPPRPVILTDAISHWRAMGRWTPQFFKDEYGDLEVVVDGEAMALGELVDRVEKSTEDNPAPYLRNQALAEWPPELLAEVSPMPDCTKPNWLESRLFPRGKSWRPSRCISGAEARSSTFSTTTAFTPMPS